MIYMAVQKKKKKPNSRVRKSPGFIWTPQRKKAALLISEGTKNYEEIAFEVGVEDRTLRRWRQSEVFLEEVSRLTLANEKATREGLLRLAYKAIEEKIGRVADDRSTVLEWSKFIADLQGFLKQKVELDANMKHDIHDPSKMTDDELQKAIDEDAKKLIEAGLIPDSTKV